MGSLDDFCKREMDTVSRKSLDDADKKNVSDAASAGLETRVIRKYDDVGLHGGKDDCEFCKSREGEWSYRDAISHGVFQRHPGCECTIDYVTAKGSQRQVDWKNNKWENIKNSGIIKIRKQYDPSKYEPDYLVGKSLSAAFKDAIVKLPDGSITRLTPGSRIEKIQVIAGFGKQRKIDEIDVLTSVFKETENTPELWKKLKGLGYVEYDGESYRAELHFYSHPSIGKVRFKVKPDAGGNWFYDED